MKNPTQFSTVFFYGFLPVPSPKQLGHLGSNKTIARKMWWPINLFPLLFTVLMLIKTKPYRVVNAEDHFVPPPPGYINIHAGDNTLQQWYTERLLTTCNYALCNPSVYVLFVHTKHHYIMGGSPLIGEHSEVRMLTTVNEGEGGGRSKRKGGGEGEGEGR